MNDNDGIETADDVHYINTPMTRDLAQKVSVWAGRLFISRAELMRRAINEYLEHLEKVETDNG